MTTIEKLNPKVINFEELEIGESFFIANVNNDLYMKIPTIYDNADSMTWNAINLLDGDLIYCEHNDPCILANINIQVSLQ